MENLSDRELLQLDRIQKFSRQIRAQEAIIADLSATIKAVADCPWANIDDRTRDRVTQSMEIINQMRLA
jgi:hypothetical protein